ncbi:MAG: hypothetical protein A2451_12370 [Bdellovibrionales bacterium RIFOXYC2_FULL_39_8]|nr:MAG: hypothetical protein A2385_12760 [Bdellovibrionales bacterium RIFOXYB1_FULL_39_21]OFZ43704.1 MAG: hypothetical protein A2485_04715 [Bdellovibrionales bacterium RIFOXYC12_FULL_39_17]OFZ46446.1 MAG: hypothetical protein A2404_08615 [Bdellovibrionales bacterium RIFOXYC1_FULL_39_130]OFZ72154.1 MAG: hypothetical protein A2451_12370 [Bdellovibrionales bacterium RIFOXYC2_FULL_39_8]OFZ75160.1 MAG: hypothetical protein A2560_10630 [Bdellovibrionales bacterium RIFOXYD1_FULL_39_84]HLE11355.1 3'-5
MKKRSSSTEEISCDEIVILDFETTGLTPPYDRVIEVAAAIVANNEIVDTFTHLMYPGRSIPYFITDLTGITTSMLKGKPSPEEIMPELKKFIGNRPIFAHNASFDKRFLEAEMARVGLTMNNPVLCTMILSRKLIPQAYNHKLSTLASHLNINATNAHRALADVKVTAKLWSHLYSQISTRAGIERPALSMLTAISKKPKHMIPKYFEKINSALMCS